MTEELPRLSVDLASFKMALTGKGMGSHLRELAAGLDEMGYAPDESTEIVRRSTLTILMDFCRERGLGGEQVAAQFEALAARIRSGEAATAAKDYRAELVRLGHAVILPKDETPSTGEAP